MTQKNLDALLAGNGDRAQKFLNKFADWQTDNPNALFNQEVFNLIMRAIDEQEWEPIRDAAAVLGLWNHENPNLRLPQEMIGEILTYVALPSLPRGRVLAKASQTALDAELVKKLAY